MLDQDHIIRDTVAAAIDLLLGGRRMKEGLVVTGSNRLDPVARAALCHTAVTSGHDVVHFGFGDDDRGSFGLTDIQLLCPRGAICHGKSGCTLWLSEGGGRVLILPRVGHRGSFRLLPGEIVQLPTRPVDEAAGAARAHAALAQRIEQNTLARAA